MRQRPKRDVAQEITNLIIATIEAGTLPWRRPWKKTGMGGAPLRAAGVPYTGINRLYLWAVADHYGYGSRYWMTWRQAIELGGKVRKGETAEPSIYFNSTKKTAIDQATGEESSKTIRFMRAYSVFNASQIDGLPPHFYPSPVPEAPPTPSQKAAAIERFFSPVPADIRLGGDRAFYSPGADYIQLPHPNVFNTEDGFVATKAHELGHWSGHASRLAREFGKRFGDKAYAFEELVVRRVGANKGVKICLLDSWENPCVPDLPVPVMNRLKSRKGNGTIACREKAQTAEAIVGRAGHRKVRTAKATLPELQSSGFYPRQRRSDGCSVAPCRNRFAHENRSMKGVWQPSAPGPVGTACPPSVGSKGRTERLPASHLLVRVNTGSPKWARQRPTWRQSRHSSQMPGAMPRTAIFGWTTTDERCRATGAELLTSRVKGGSACETGQPTGWAC